MSDGENNERALDDESDFDDGESRECYWCGGDGWSECEDLIQCTRPHRGRLCQCASCGGSGRAKDMTIW